jgi:hypothetical protein
MMLLPLMMMTKKRERKEAGYRSEKQKEILSKTE